MKVRERYRCCKQGLGEVVFSRISFTNRLDNRGD